jgi:hypothetical protein
MTSTTTRTGRSMNIASTMSPSASGGSTQDIDALPIRRCRAFVRSHAFTPRRALQTLYDAGPDRLGAVLTSPVSQDNYKGVVVAITNVCVAAVPARV